MDDKALVYELGVMARGIAGNADEADDHSEVRLLREAAQRINFLGDTLRSAMRCSTQEEWRAWVRSQPAYQSDTANKPTIAQQLKAKGYPRTRPKLANDDDTEAKP